MKFYDFDDFLSNDNAESEIERLRKVQAEVRRIKKRRLFLAVATALFTVAGLSAYLLITRHDTTEYHQPRR